MAFCSRCGVSIEGRFCQACGFDNNPGENSLGVEDTVNHLYSLRAGISLISVQMDKIKAEENKNQIEIEKRNAQINGLQEKIEHERSEINNTKSTIGKYKSTIATNKINIRSDNLTKAQKERDDKERTLKSQKAIHKITATPFYVISAIFGIPGIILAVPSALLLAVSFIISDLGVAIFRALEKVLPFDGTLFVFALLGVGSVCVGIGVLFRFIGKKIANKVNIDSELISYNEKIYSLQKLSNDSAKFEQEIPVLEDKIKHYEKEIEQAKQLTNEVQVSLALRKKEMATQIAYYRECNNEAFNALVKEYSSLLDTRDWENLDLVIYYLETRRAISVREALQLADRQHQTEAIIQTFKVATEQIKETITLNSQRLESTVLGCTRVISSGLDNISGRLNAIEVNQEIATSHLRNLSSQISVNNALQAKANTSSEQMMRDIRQMRVYADNSAIKARNS